MNEPRDSDLRGLKSRPREPRPSPPDAPDLAHSALFLDIDGTLINLAERHDAVLVPADTRSLVNDLYTDTKGATALVSGRRIADIDRFFPGFEGVVIASHGAERRENGELWQYPAKGGLDLVLLTRMARIWAENAPGVLLEEKPCSVVLHFRQAPGKMADGLKFMQYIADHADGFTLHRAKMAVEIRPEDVSKRRAVERLIERWPSRRPIACGDDLTDEGMFEVVNRLGGHSIKIGGGGTCARFRLAGPRELTDTLRGWLEERQQ